MFISLKELQIRKIEFDQSFEPGEIDLADPALRQVSPLAAKGVARLLPNSGGQIRLVGSYRVVIEADCDRCLGLARFVLSEPFDLFYHPMVETTAEEVEIDEGAAELAFYQGDGFLLEEALRDQALLALPMQRVCREDCLGICPVCGADRNETPCQCREKPSEERWSALKKISITR